MNRHLLCSLPVFTGLLLATSAIAQSLQTAVVISTGPGTLLTIQRQGKTTTSWLGCIDIPPREQKPWGKYGAERVKQLLPKGQTVQIREISRDHNGHPIVEVFVNEESINLQLVTEGVAVIHPQYLEECRLTKAQYLLAESEAQQQRIGLWQQKNPCMPWDYRRGRCR
jgi:micrococcal nuclease